MAAEVLTPRGPLGVQRDAHRARMRRVERVHFIGIGGSGMCGIAEVLATAGYRVSGSDQHDGAAITRLRSLGVTVAIGHRAEQVVGADVVVVSTAVPEHNPELQAARAARQPIVARAEMLGELMRNRYGIAVAGTHGKTTTTCMIAEIYRAAGVDPTFVVGGLVKSADANARLGAGDVIVVEADESDASFLYLQPMAAVITNIDRDHMDTYGGDFARLCDAFVDFTHRLPFYGPIAVCIDDDAVRALRPRVPRPLLEYGFAADAAYRVRDLQIDGLVSRFVIERPAPHPPLAVELNLPGRHNVSNAAAAIAIATDDGIADDAIRAGLAHYAGVGRRFDMADGVRIGAATVTLVDDYGHHPTEVAAVIATARSVWPARRLVMIYQLHRYTRTRDLFDDFARVLADVDVLVLLDVYAAGEAPIAGADADALATAMQRRDGRARLRCRDLEAVRALLPTIVADGDVVVTQGAGNVSAISARLRGANA